MQQTVCKLWHFNALGARCWSGESDVAGGGRNAPRAEAAMVSVLAETVVFVPDTPEPKR